MGESQQFMIYISREGETFQQEVEMMGCKVQGSQLLVKNTALALAISQLIAKKLE